MTSRKTYPQRPAVFRAISGRSMAKLDFGYNEAQYTKDTLNLIQKASENDISYNEDGYTLLHLAVQEGEKEFVKALLNRGINVHSVTEKGGTPLSLAIGLSKKEGTIEIITILLNAGADLDLKSGNYTPREMIKMFNKPELYQFLAEDDEQHQIEKAVLDFSWLDEHILVKSVFAEEDYNRFVSENNLILDPEYLNFLKKYNGYKPVKKIKCLNGFETYISLIFPFADVKRVFKDTQKIKNLKDIYLPIANAGGENNYIYISK